MFFCCLISTCIAFYISLLMKDDKNAQAYIGILVLVLGITFKLFDYFEISNLLIKSVFYFCVYHKFCYSNTSIK